MGLVWHFQYMSEGHTMLQCPKTRARIQICDSKKYIYIANASHQAPALSNSALHCSPQVTS